MFCPKCGKLNNEDARFCQYCGFDLSGINIQKTEQSQTEEKSVKKINNLSEKKISSEYFHNHGYWHRVSEGKKIAGVCTGLAHQFNAPILIMILRLFFIISTIFYGFGIILYIILCLLMSSPVDTKENSKGNEHQLIIKPYFGEYAGFLRRLYANLIDCVIILLIGGLIFITVSLAIPKLYNEDSIFPIILLCCLYLMFPISVWLYYAFLESSEKQATLGKQLIGVIVTDVKGNKISFLRATGRFFGRALSGLPLCIGYLLPIITEKKQTLHDMITGTIVVKKNSISDVAVIDILTLCLILLLIAISLSSEFISNLYGFFINDYLSVNPK